MNERPLVVKQGKRKLTEAEKADIREHMREFEERYAAQTTDEGRAQVVAEAQEHRKWLAQELGVSVPQIGGVSAYKFKGDGGLELRPFADPQTGVAESRMPVQSDSPPIVLRESAPLPQDEPGASPKIEAMYDNPTKRAWRMAIRNAIVENFTPEYLRTARVVCLPGQALQEVTDVYLPLGIRPENIICLERNKDFANTMRANAQKLELAVEIRNESVEEFLKSEHPPISIASFDFLGPLHQGFFLELHKLRKAQKFAIVTNFQQRRERTGPRLALQANALLVRDVRSKQPPAITSLIRGSQLREFSGTKGAVDYLDQAYEGESAPALAEARDDGMYKLLEGFAGQRVDEVADNLYAEVGESPPHFSDMAALKQFVNGGAMAVTRMIEEVVAQNPRLEKKLTPTSERNAAGELIQFSNTGKRGFLPFLAAIVTASFHHTALCDIRRYGYASESAGSPFQTDMMVRFNWRPSFERVSPEAYRFFRDLLRAFGRHGDAVTIEIRKPDGKPLQPHSEIPSGLKLAFTAPGQNREAKLIEVQKLISFYGPERNKHVKGTSEQDLLSPGRTVITPGPNDGQNA